jgi:predicted GNAT superfamily acetyltransferase
MDSNSQSAELSRQADMIAFRSLRPDDCVDVLRINAAAGPAVFRLDPPELSRLTRISSLHLVAVRDDDAIAGYALAFSSDDPYDGQEFLAFRASIAEPFWYVDQIAVESRLRSMGVGRMLYEALVSGASLRGVTAICCEVNTTPPNADSLAFHRRLAFERVGTLGTFDGREVALLRRSTNV